MSTEKQNTINEFYDPRFLKSFFYAFEPLTMSFTSKGNILKLFRAVDENTREQLSDKEIGQLLIDFINLDMKKIQIKFFEIFKLAKENVVNDSTIINLTVRKKDELDCDLKNLHVYFNNYSVRRELTKIYIDSLIYDDYMEKRSKMNYNTFKAEINRFLGEEKRHRPFYQKSYKSYLNGVYGTNQTFPENTTLSFIDVQNKFDAAVEFCLNVNPIYEKLCLLSIEQRYYLFSQTQLSGLELPNAILFDRPSDLNKLNTLEGETLDEIIENLKEIDFEFYEEYIVDTIEKCCKLEFAKMVENHITTRKCKLCSSYFLLSSDIRPDTLYCEKCRKSGARLAYKLKVEENDLLKLFNREYQRRYSKIRNYPKPMRDKKREDIQVWVKKAKEKMQDENMIPKQFEEWIENEKESEKNGR